MTILQQNLLKEIANFVSCPLSIIINQSPCTGIFPHKLEIIKVIPLYKKDDNKSFVNYRPISLLFSISFFKGLLLTNYTIIIHRVAYESLYGFHKLHSAELAAKRWESLWLAWSCGFCSLTYCLLLLLQLWLILHRLSLNLHVPSRSNKV